MCLNWFLGTVLGCLVWPENDLLKKIFLKVYESLRDELKGRLFLDSVSLPCIFFKINFISSLGGNGRVKIPYPFSLKSSVAAALFISPDSENVVLILIFSSKKFVYLSLRILHTEARNKRNTQFYTSIILYMVQSATSRSPCAPKGFHGVLNYTSKVTICNSNSI
jgi:hypothetical protein